MSDEQQNQLPPPPPIAPGLPGGPPANADDREVIAVQIGIEEYKELMAILQELPYRISGQVMNKLAPGVQAIFAPEVDPDADGGAE